MQIDRRMSALASPLLPHCTHALPALCRPARSLCRSLKPARQKARSGNLGFRKRHRERGTGTAGSGNGIEKAWRDGGGRVRRGRIHSSSEMVGIRQLGRVLHDRPARPAGTTDRHDRPAVTSLGWSCRTGEELEGLHGALPSAVVDGQGTCRLGPGHSWLGTRPSPKGSGRRPG